MGIRILATDSYNSEEGAILFDSVTGWSIGPVFESGEMAEAFTQWLPESPKDYCVRDLQTKYEEFVKVWRYCGLTDEEREEYEKLEGKGRREVSGEDRKRYHDLKAKIMDAREETWRF